MRIQQYSLADEEDETELETGGSDASVTGLDLLGEKDQAIRCYERSLELEDADAQLRSVVVPEAGGRRPTGWSPRGDGQARKHEDLGPHGACAAGVAGVPSAVPGSASCRSLPLFSIAPGASH